MASSIPTVAALVTVNAMVAVYLDARETGDPRSATECVRLVWLRRRALVSGFIRAFAIVYVLLERDLAAARLRLTPCDERTGVDAMCRPVEVLAVGRSEALDERVAWSRRQITDRADAELAQPSGFSMSEASFASSLFGAMPSEQVSPVSTRMRRLIARASSSGVRSDAVASR